MACFLILLSLVVLVVNAKVKYNSQLVPPFNIQLADTTGDGIAGMRAGEKIEGRKRRNA